MTAGAFNGRTGEWLRWLGGLALAALVAYYTAQGAMQKELAIIDTREQTRWIELQRRLEQIEGSTQRSEEMFRQVLQEWSRGIDRSTGEPLPLQHSIDRGR
jgi:hypothetical protein